jgi:hypothetical protein
VVGLLDKHLEGVPNSPYQGLDHLPDEVAAILKNRVEAVAPMWTVGHANNWDRTVVGGLLQSLKSEERDRLRSIETFAVWLQLDPGVIAKGVFHSHDKEAAHALKEYLTAPKRGIKGTWKTAEEDGWLTVQLQTELSELRREMEK